MHGRVCCHKCYEFNYYSEESVDYYTRVSLTTKGDHAGLKINLRIRRSEIEVHVYDDRHWDWENDCWETYK